MIRSVRHDWRAGPHQCHLLRKYIRSLHYSRQKERKRVTGGSSLNEL
jgi:hypothetical protein